MKDISEQKIRSKPKMMKANSKYSREMCASLFAEIVEIIEGFGLNKENVSVESDISFKNLHCWRPGKFVASQLFKSQFYTTPHRLVLTLYKFSILVDIEFNSRFFLDTYFNSQE